MARYSRQMLLPHVGRRGTPRARCDVAPETEMLTAAAAEAWSLARLCGTALAVCVSGTGQERLKAASVLVVGAGGLGSPAALYLAAAGIGTLGLVDDDVVEVSNLHRQVLHDASRAGQPKASSGAASVGRINPHVRCTPHLTRLTPANADELVGAYDVVLDCTDNAATRYLLNDTCVRRQRPLVSGAALRWEGQVRSSAASVEPGGGGGGDGELKLPLGRSFGLLHFDGLVSHALSRLTADRVRPQRRTLLALHLS